ncbi:MAG TPA: monovalent cation/H+ antiporter complex subunit F [Thermodesulfobacteriota bacterium]|nr:monovalent cation/H+ antiporter complex subunit F [Thermodesulfobacteriota bacterium]
MDIWLLSAAMMILALIPCGVVIVHAPVMDRLVALQMAGVVCVLVLVLMAEGFRQPSFYDLALTLALLSLPANLVFAFFLERWL